MYIEREMHLYCICVYIYIYIYIYRCTHIIAYTAIYTLLYTVRAICAARQYNSSLKTTNSFEHNIHYSI